MKKLILSAVLITVLTCGAAFAQVSVSGNAKSYWIPYMATIPQDEDGEVLHQTAVQVPWGGPDISSGISVNGWSDYAGFNLSMDVAYGTGNRASNPFSVKAGHSYVWVKPIEQVKLTLGTPYDETLMGKVGSSNLSRYVLDSGYNHNDNRLELGDGQYNIFTRINPYSWGNADFKANQNLAWPEIAAAAMLNITPIDGLNIIAFFAPEMFIGDGTWTTIVGSSVREDAPSVNGDQKSDIGNEQDFYDAKQVYKNLQVAAGYEIPGFGLVRAQYIGLRSTVELAAQIKALGDVMLDVGLKIPFEGIGAEKPGDDVAWNESYMYKVRKDFQISVGATYRYYDFNLLGRIDTAFAGADASPDNPFDGTKTANRGLDLLVYLVPSYNLSFATVGLDFGFEYEAEDDFSKDKYSHDGAGIKTGLGAWIEKKMGPGSIKGGLVVQFPTDWHGLELPTKILFPVFVEVAF